MAAIMTGGRLTSKEKSRATLSVRSPIVTNLLAGSGFDGVDIDGLHAFCNLLIRDQQRWSVARGAGLFGRRGNITKREAERLWSGAFGPSNGRASQ